MFFGVYKMKKIPYTQCDIRCEKKAAKNDKTTKKAKQMAIVTTNTKGVVKQVGIPTT